jgi:hypothetical protein
LNLRVVITLRRFNMPLASLGGCPMVVWSLS